MDQEETIAALLSENEKLGQENDQLKWTLSVVKENHDLRGRMSFNNDTLEESTGILFFATRWQLVCSSELLSLAIRPVC